MARSRRKLATRFLDVVARVVDPAMLGAGLQRGGPLTWWEQRTDGSWVVLEIQVDDRSTTRTQMSFVYEAVAWPPGTWERRQSMAGPHQRPGPVPFAGGDAPVRQGEKPPGDWPWELDASDDLEEEGCALRDSLLVALEWARQHAGVEGALATRGAFGGLTDLWAIVMLRAAAPHDPRLPEIVDRFTTHWRADPRPITLRADVERWRAEAGLAPLDNLPDYWNPRMSRDTIERYGWPGAALVEMGIWFSYPDGTTTTEPPPDWPTTRNDPPPRWRPPEDWLRPG